MSHCMMVHWTHTYTHTAGVLASFLHLGTFFIWFFMWVTNTRYLLEFCSLVKSFINYLSGSAAQEKSTICFTRRLL